MLHHSRLRATRRRLNLEHLEDRTTPSSLAMESGLLPDRVLLMVSDPAALTTVANSPLTVGTTSLGFGAYSVALSHGSPVDSALSVFATIPGVEIAERDDRVGVNMTPNDSAFGSLWGMNNTGQSGGVVDADIDAPEAWDTARGTGLTAVGVIDTGIDYTHPDLYLNIWINQGEIPTSIRNALVDLDSDGLITFYDLNQTVNQGAGKITDLNANGRIDGGDLLAPGGWENGADNDGNSYIDDLLGWDFVNNDNDPMDDNNHGTHCAGTIGGIGNNGVGVAGVAWRTRMAALKFLGANGSGSTSGAIAAVNYANGNGIKITSNSWGGGGFSQTMFNAINNHRSNGGVFIAAAGNSASNNDTTANYPSNYAVDNVVAVAATTRTDTLSSFSSYGATTVDLGAPGSSIYSTTRNNTYASFNGTSMATPHVSGAIAVVWDANPTLSYSQVIARILQNTRPIAALAGRTVTGGVLNLAAALPQVPPPPPPPTDTSGPRVTSSAFSGSSLTDFNKVRFTFNEPVQSSSFSLTDVVSLIGPLGLITPTSVSAVTGTNNQFDLFFPTQTAGGGYTVTIGPAILDMTGNPMNQDNDLINGENPADRFVGNAALTAAQSFTNPSKYPILDNKTTTVPVVVPVGSIVADVNVTVNVNHTWVSDLRMTLVSPNGTSVLLVNRRGGSGDNFTNTVFDDEVARLIVNGSAPFTGSYQPEARLSNFDGKSAQGVWNLQVADLATADTGAVTTVTLTILFNNGGSAVAVFGRPDDPTPVVTLIPPPVRAAGDFVRAAERPEVQAPITLTRVESPTVTLPDPVLAPSEDSGVVIVAPPRPVMDHVANLLADFAPIEV